MASPIYTVRVYVPIRHGDLKPGNVLVNSGRRALLADFGLSKALDTGPTGFTTGNDARGTVRYSSPEVLLQGTVAESLPNDIWSWGCLVLEALTDKIPFASIQPEPQLIVALVQGKSPSDETDYSLLPTQLVDLLAKCWSREPNERPTAARCLVIVNLLPSSPPALPQHQHYIPPNVTSPQNGGLWNELQQRYVNQVQHAQQLSQNATKMLDELQQPHQQEGLQLNQLGNETPPCLNMQAQAQAQAQHQLQQQQQQQQPGQLRFNPGQGQQPPLGKQIPGLGPMGQSSGGLPAVQSSQRPQTTVQGTSTTSTSLSSMSNEHDAASSSFNFTLTPAIQRSSLNNNIGSIFASSDINDMTFGLGEAMVIRRANSDGARRTARGVRSEDFSLLRVPIPNADFIRSVTAVNGSLAPIALSPPLGGPGPQRRRGSGMGHERISSLGSSRYTPSGQQGGRPRAAAAQQQQQQPTPASLPVPSTRPNPSLQGSSPKASGQPPSKQADPTGVSHPTGAERSSLKRRAEDDAADHQGSPGPSSSSKRARKTSPRL